MSDTGNIQLPAAMVDAAAKVLFNAERDNGTDWWQSADDEARLAEAYGVDLAGRSEEQTP